MKILGIDLSLTGTGLALYSDPIESAPDLSAFKGIERWERGDMQGICIKTVPNSAIPRYARWLHIYRAIQRFCRKPDYVVIEGYSFSSKFSGEAVAELGGIVRFSYFMNDVPITEVAPVQLKKFVAGKSTAKKDVMLKALYQRWGIDVDNDNIADAIGLCLLGRALFDQPAGGLALTGPQGEVMEAIRNPKQKSRKTAKRRT